MLRWFPILMFLAGCPGGGNPILPDDTDETDDTDTQDSEDSDTPVVDTGWGSDTDGGPDTADSDTVPPDDTEPVDDTGGCAYGEEPDCDGNCYPAHFMGDGSCDDGMAWPSNFNCVQYRYDGGDCGLEPPPGCPYVMRLDVNTFPGEIGWKIIDQYGTVQFEVPPGTYGEQFRIYDHPLNLSSGEYTVRATDSFGDGWGGAQWRLYDARSGEQLASGTVTGPLFPPLFPGPQHVNRRVDVTCDPTSGGNTCAVDVAMFNGATAAENGWQIRSSNGFVLKNKAPGTYADGQVAVDTVDLAPGTYSFRMTDGGTRNSGTLGWQGGHVEVRTPGGYVMGYGTLEGYAAGGFSFKLDCAQSDWTPLTPPPPTPVEVDCSRMRVVTTTSNDGPQVGYAVHDFNTATQLAARDPGALFGGVVNDVALPVSASGTFAVILKDANGDGWAGSTLQIKDASTNTTVLSTSLPDGFGSAALFALTCANLEPEDTGDTDLTPPDGECSDGAEPDCDGVCWPSSFVGDGFCDDGVQYAANFNCAAFSFDRNDCRR